MDETGVVAFDTSKNGMTSRAYPLSRVAGGEQAITSCAMQLTAFQSDLATIATTFVSQALRLATLLL